MILTTLSAVIALVQPPSAPAESAKPAPPTGAPQGTYLEIPLKGEFGKEITAPGIRDCLRAARSRGAAAVVLVFDTPGGRVADANAIAAVIDKERHADHNGHDLKVYSVIHRAISASVWPLSHSDRIFFAPGAALGAAVAFHWDVKTGNAEVDSKFNAAMTAEVAGAAEARGQPGCVYRAMMLKEARLYGWKKPDGKYALSDTRPGVDVKGVEELDTDATVLAWTADQAARYGFGTIMPSTDLGCLGKLAGDEAWQPLRETGAKEMNRAFKDVERKAADTERAKQDLIAARDSIVETAKRISTMTELAEAADPMKTVPLHVDTHGFFASDTQIMWRKQSDQAVGDWNTVLTLLGDLERAERRSTQALEQYNTAMVREYQARLYLEKAEPLKLDPIEHGIDIKLARKSASDAVSRITTGRIRTR